jgi:hypothetical protein
MKRWTSTQVLAPLLLLGLAVEASQPLVAMRVEVEANANGPGPVALVVVQVAPEDRARLGSRVWLRIELRRGAEVVDRVSQVAEMDRQGRLEAELDAAPGDYELRAEISGSTDDITGFWEGRVTVPQASPRRHDDVEPPPPVGAAVLESAAVSGADAGPAQAEPVPRPTQAGVAPPPPGDVEDPVAPVAHGDVEPVDSTATGVEPSEDDRPTPGLVDMTVLAVAGGRPVPRLSPAQLELQIDGTPAVIERLAGAGQTGLSLALVTDVSNDLLPDVRDQIGRFALQAAANGGEISLVVSAPGVQLVRDWGGPAGIATAVRPSPGATTDLAGAVELALNRLAGRTGRRFVVVISDGGASTSKAAWEGAAAANDASGALVLLVGFRDRLDKASRRQLERIVDASGGKSYMIRDAGMLAMVLEHYADLVGGSYVLSWRPSASRGAPARVKLKGLSEVDLHHPARVRQ